MDFNLINDAIVEVRDYDRKGRVIAIRRELLQPTMGVIRRPLVNLLSGDSSVTPRRMTP